MTDKELIENLRTAAAFDDSTLLNDAANRLEELTQLRPMAAAPIDGNVFLCKAYLEGKMEEKFFIVVNFNSNLKRFIYDSIYDSLVLLGWLSLPTITNENNKGIET